MEHHLCLQCAAGHEDESWEAGEVLLGVAQQKRGESLGQGRKGKMGSQEPCWLSDVLSHLVPTANLGDWKYHAHSTVE